MSANNNNQQTISSGIKKHKSFGYDFVLLSIEDG